MLLSVQGVAKAFASGGAHVRVFSDVSFDLGAGETVALTGESGSGKSTLLHICAGLDASDSGRIMLCEQDIAGLSDGDRAQLRRDKVGLVFQQFNLIPSLSVMANLSFQARLAGREDQDWTRALADRLGLSALLSRYPEQLSGGQQQRVAIGRALAARPPLLLADEPTGNLDETTGDGVMDLLQELVAETGAGLLMVTHSERLAGRLQRRLHLSGGGLV
ncbi:ABC transporter ATP-binding protein [Actibacterium lipolyticum]|uniref:Putative ABC transporter ATP-binding protein/MT1014 n=1 Tax=Actibacterium lipolyticum TaxID=1524263 RepID=A0A238KQ59_9RHOB|nr:ABC transporter ATP-binding protein [Actibacterium lipolyticum]SMX44953.1 putative ABC transporter ATP-binding protein/MT1014 [Actibacterium lipolyticum]